jgi:hypothetical protein
VPCWRRLQRVGGGGLVGGALAGGAGGRGAGGAVGPGGLAGVRGGVVWGGGGGCVRDLRGGSGGSGAPVWKGQVARGGGVFGLVCLGGWILSSSRAGRFAQGAFSSRVTGGGSRELGSLHLATGSGLHAVQPTLFHPRTGLFVFAPVLGPTGREWSVASLLARADFPKQPARALPRRGGVYRRVGRGGGGGGCVRGFGACARWRVWCSTDSSCDGGVVISVAFIDRVRSAWAVSRRVWFYGSAVPAAVCWWCSRCSLLISLAINLQGCPVGRR